MQFINFIFVLTVTISTASAQNRVGGGGVSFIGKPIAQPNSECSKHKVGTGGIFSTLSYPASKAESLGVPCNGNFLVDVNGLVLIDGQLVDAKGISINIESADDLKSLKEDNVSALILNDGSQLSIDEVYGGEMGGD